MHLSFILGSSYMRQSILQTFPETSECNSIFNLPATANSSQYLTRFPTRSSLSPNNLHHITTTHKSPLAAHTKSGLFGVTHSFRVFTLCHIFWHKASIEKYIRHLYMSPTTYLLDAIVRYFTYSLMVLSCSLFESDNEIQAAPQCEMRALLKQQRK